MPKQLISPLIEVRSCEIKKFNTQYLTSIRDVSADPSR